MQATYSLLPYLSSLTGDSTCIDMDHNNNYPATHFNKSNKIDLNQDICHHDASTLILWMNGYGIISSVLHPTITSTTNMVGQPLMRYIHNDDIPLLCGALQRQDEPSIDLRCNFSMRPTDFDTLYHFKATITSTWDTLCVMRPLHRTPSSFCRSIFLQLQQTLWSAAEQGFIKLARVLSDRCYSSSSFWIKASELALYCLVAETKSRRAEILDRWRSWLPILI
ncbi:hypothetical protein BC941DRAFT_466662 [Chlamydoabsidia padenii]|nr:hypothetical protein BC941DRAFT_466662 [Chlamydoabsidia padenii]